MSEGGGVGGGDAIARSGVDVLKYCFAMMDEQRSVSLQVESSPSQGFLTLHLHYTHLCAGTLRYLAAPWET